MAGIIGFGAKLEVNSGTSQAFVAVDSVKMVSIPAGDVAAIDATHMGLTTPYKVKTAGLIDPGKMTFESIYSKASYNQLIALLGKGGYGTPSIPATAPFVQWRVSSPDEDGSGAGTAQTFTFAGFLDKLETHAETEALMVIKGEVTISGPITVA